MVFEFLTNLDTTTTFLLLIIFILFVLAMKKILGIVKNALIIAVASVLFPIVMNKFFGFNIPMDTDSIISFILLGLGIYFVYLVAKSIYKMLKFTERFAKEKVPKLEKPPKSKEETPAPEKEKKGKKDKKREKELDEREKELSKREQELRWKAAVQKKSGKDWTKEYHVLGDSKSKTKDEDDTINVSRSPITPLPVIEHKKKRRKEKED